MQQHRGRGVDAVANKSRLKAAHVRMEIVSAIATLQKFNRCPS
jgi:hypothetical protein